MHINTNGNIYMTIKGLSTECYNDDINMHLVSFMTKLSGRYPKTR